MGVKIEYKSPSSGGDDGKPPFDDSVPAKPKGEVPAKKAAKKAGKKATKIDKEDAEAYALEPGDIVAVVDDDDAKDVIIPVGTTVMIDYNGNIVGPSGEVYGKAKVEKVQPIAHESTLHPTGVLTEVQTPVGEPLYVEEKEPMANVGLSVSVTKQIVQYEPIKYSVSLYMPCLPNQHDIDNAFSNIETWIDGKVTAFLEQCEKQKNGDGDDD